MTLLDEEPIVIDLLDFDPECDWSDCAKIAEWAVTLSCGDAGVVCTKHLGEMRDIEQFGSGHCSRCDTSFVKITGVEPLRGSA